MDKGYTTEEKIEEYLNIPIADGDADDFILAVQALIENFTGRNFKADTEASARKYDGNSQQYLNIDDCVEVSKVEVGNNSWGDSMTELVNSGSTPEYYLLPTNYEADKYPINKIGARNKFFIFGHANHQITAKWGYSTTPPADLIQSATVLAGGMYNYNRSGKTGEIKSEKIGEYQVAYADQKGMNDFDEAMKVLKRYKKFEI